MKLALRTLLISLIVIGCGQDKTNKDQSANTFSSNKTEFVDYISAYTSGVIPARANIKVKLSQAVEGVEANAPIAEGIFNFDPAIEGSAYWEDSQTAVFNPDNLLSRAVKTNATFNLGAIIPEAKDKGKFEFSFKAIPQNYEVHINGMSTLGDKKSKVVSITGYIETADVAVKSKVEEMFSASQNHKTLTIEWEHLQAEKKHNFTIEKVTRGQDESTVSITWEGTPIAVDKAGNEDYVVPGLKDYRVVSSKLVASNPNYISIIFSNPIQEKQNLKGFIKLATKEPRYVINGNELKLYPNETLYGSAKLTIFKKIKNSEGLGLKEDYESFIQMPSAKPLIKMAANKGAILPNSQGLIIPFEAVGLRAVDVKIIEIFENNVIQYLQTNNLGNSRQLSRVGRPVARKTISLLESGVPNLNKWNKFTLDLATYIDIKPGAIYQIDLSFRKKHALFFCGETEEDLSNTEEENWNTTEESSYWDWSENYYNGYYDWQQRNNPCDDSYYMRGKNVKKIVFASDLGLMAKRGDHGQLHVFVNNMLDTKPVADVNFAVYDFQQQVIGSGISNSEGKAKIEVKGEPFVLMAKSGDQFGYLKLDHGSSLSLSNFNVTGNKVQKGIKGYIYGERGVWRPGDDIFLTFILEDKTAVLPEDYPVVMELKDPSGQLVKKVVKTTSKEGMFGFILKTDTDAPTGTWQAVVKAGGAQFTKALKIEAIKPNRLKIKLDFKKDRLTALDKSISGDLNVAWLHGALAKGLKAEYEMIVVPTKTTFEDYPNFSFDDQSKTFYSDRQNIYSGNLDQKGFAKVNIDMSVGDNAPGALKAIFTGKVFEEGGNFSVDKVSIPYYPYKTFVGLKVPEGDKRGMLLTNKDHNIRIVTVDANGQPVSRQNLKVELFKLNWRWWWDNSSNNVSNYVGRSHRTPVAQGKINTNDGEGSWNMEVQYPSWGRYYLRVTDPESGHSAGKITYIDWPGWAGKGKRGDAGGVTMLNFEVDKEEYKTGEKVKITFPSTVGGRVLVSLETGKKILKTYWVETEAESTSFEFETTPEMAPNVYAHMTLLQPHAQTANDLPIRMYGVQSIKVVDAETLLKPVLTMPAELQPEQQFMVQVNEKSGKPMAYTIAMVDDGLLDLTKFQTPSPWSTFYAREALGIKTWDVYDDVIGAYGGKIERLLSIGGDGELEGPTAKKANRFKPVVKFLGPFSLESGEKATHQITMPQYVGSVRMMVVAAKDGAYGSTDQTVPVKQPVMVLATMPRVAGPNEEMDLPVTVFVTDPKVKSVVVNVALEGKLNMVSSAKKSLTFSEPGEQVIYFKVQASDALGIAKVHVEAKASKTTAKFDIEMDVRASNPEMTDVQAKLVGGNESWEVQYNPLGIVGTNEAMIELSSLPSLNLEQRLRYLIRYPHGCIEQTTSSVFAQLYLEELVNLPEASKIEISTNIKAAINRLKRFQTENGGFSYWPGQPEESDWGTNYAGHFLVEAEKRGYALPNDMLNRWKKYQKSQANSWSKGGRRHNDLIQAYRLYGLALAGSKEMGAMNRMKAMDDLSNIAKWKLALAYAVAGYNDPAESLVDGLSSEVAKYTSWSYSYGSRLRDRAMILEVMSYLDRREEAYPILEEIAEQMGNNKRWMSTQTTAYSLIGVVAYANGNTLNDPFDFEINVGSVVANFEQGKYVTQVNINEAESKLPIVMKNKGSSPIYARLIRNGIPLESSDVEGQENITMNVKYVNEAGTTINPMNISQGTDFIAEVKVHHPGIRAEYKALALTQIFPSGWEIINTRMDGTDSFDDGAKPEYMDIRDDRVMQYFDLKPGQSKTFKVRLNASYKGKFYLPSVSVEAMYDNSIYAHTNGKWVRVVE